MINKNSLIIGIVIALVLGFTAGYLVKSQQSPATPVFQDGTYRGAFIDLGSVQIVVQFTLQDGIVTDARFRHLEREDYELQTQQEPYRSVVQQYQDALAYLVGKDLQKHLEDLYHPENVITSEVHGYTAATARTPKIISAIRDGLNRGIYNY